MADISMWHMILYFGTSFFSESRIKAVRRRIHLFNKSADGTTWPFTEAYKALLRKAAVKQGSRLISATIPCSATSPLFSSPDIFGMAPNLEFQLMPRVAAKASKTGFTGIPIVGNAGGKEKTDNSSGQQGTETKQADATTLVAGPTQSQEQERGPSHSWARGGDDETTAQKQLPGRVSGTSTRARPTPPPLNNRSADDHPPVILLDTLRPSIEFPQPAREDNHKPANSLTGGLIAGGEASSQDRDRLTRAQKLDRRLAKQVVGEFRDEAHMANIDKLQRQASFNPAAAGTPLAPKRPIKEEYGGAGPSKRRQVENSRLPAVVVGMQRASARAFEKSQEWTDARVFQVLDKLQQIRPQDVVVVDGMKSYGPGGSPSALTATDVRKGTVLLPLKLGDGYRLLVVLRLGVVESQNLPDEKPRQGTILFYDPGQSNSGEFLRGFQLAARVAQFLTHILPSYDADPGAWDMQYCATPKQQTKGSAGVALCLAAMCVVGSVPCVAQIPEEADWTFWRHFIMRCFYEPDEFVRTKTDNFRLQLIETLIRQGQLRGRTPEYQYEADDEIECVGHTTTDPMQRITHRDNNAQRLFQMVHQSHVICLRLMNHVDRGMASLKMARDKSRLLQKGPGANTQADSGNLKKEEGEEEEEQATDLASFAPWNQQRPAELSLDEHNSRQLAFEESARYLAKAIDEASVWRNAIQQAILESGESAA